MVTKKLRKAVEQIEKLKEENRLLSMSVLNIRQMYEGSIGEKQGLQFQLNNVQQLLTACVVSSNRAKKLVLKEKVLSSLGDYAGIDTKADEDGNLTIMALTIAEVAAMQEDIDGDGE